MNILWIFGYPGAGKSTLAMHIANIFREARRLGVIVEFNRTTGVNASILWQTIAYALACEYPDCRRVIVDKLKSGTLNLANATSTQIFRQLIAEPLRSLTSGDTKTPANRLPVIVIDALDECGGLEHSSWKARKDILDCFRDWQKLAPGVKLIVTSRVEQDIKLTFSNVPHTPLEILTGSSVTEISTNDIQLYMKAEFSEIARLRGLSDNWPGLEIITHLSSLAKGVFIYAVTALKFIDDPNPRAQLKSILDGRLRTGDVYGLYRQILESSFPHAHMSNDFQVVVGAIVVLQQNFTATELDELLDVMPGTVNGIRIGLRTVLDDVAEIRFRHQSFVDFLTYDANESSNADEEDQTVCPARFRINVAIAHGRLCGSLFQMMCAKLHFNICNFPSSFLRNDQLPRGHCEDAIGRSLAYACKFWGFHLSRTQSELNLDLVHIFIHDKLLYWIEGLGGLGSLIVAVPSLTSLEQRLSSSPEQVRTLLSWIKNICSHICSV